MAAAAEASESHPNYRREERQDTIRVVEYASFPRIEPEAKPEYGFTRDLSNSGMCLSVSRRETVGSLLRLCVRDVEGRPGEARVGRVVWTSPTGDGRHWLGIELLTAPSKARSASRGRPADAEYPGRLRV